jgi:GNAT superfamily N-acetyltransferase
VIEQRDDHLTTVAAVDDSTGAIVGFTELVVPNHAKRDAQPYGTAVLPAHRGHGLALSMKAEQILQTRLDVPDLDGLLTDTVDTCTR